MYSVSSFHVETIRHLSVTATELAASFRLYNQMVLIFSICDKLSHIQLIYLSLLSSRVSYIFTT